jgi:hypothetical protein
MNRGRGRRNGEGRGSWVVTLLIVGCRRLWVVANEMGCRRLSVVGCRRRNGEGRGSWARGLWVVADCAGWC